MQIGSLLFVMNRSRMAEHIKPPDEMQSSLTTKKFDENIFIRYRRVKKKPLYSERQEE